MIIPNKIRIGGQDISVVNEERPISNSKWQPTREDYLKLEEEYRALENRYIRLYNKYCKNTLQKTTESLTDKKYKLTDEYITIGDKKLYRIEALKDFAFIKKGDNGGFVESEKNLSQINDCWIYNNAMVYGDANISGNARVFDDVRVYGNAWVSGNAGVFDNAKVYGSAWVREEVRVYDNVQVFGSEHVCGSAEIGGDATVVSMSDYIVFKNWWSSGRYFTWTRSNNMWNVGCFHGTGEELIAKAYKDSELSGKEYERVVKYVELILKDSNTTTRINKIKQCLIKITRKIKLLRFKKLED